MTSNQTHTLAHLTLTTGHLRAAPRAEVSAETLRILAPLVAAGGGEIPGMPGLAVKIGLSKPGRALISVRGTADDHTYIIAALAWEQTAADAAWQHLLAFGRASAAQDGTPLASPLTRPPLPWLGVLMAIPAATLPPDRLMMLGDLERCLAWAILDAAKP